MTRRSFVAVFVAAIVVAGLMRVPASAAGSLLTVATFSSSSARLSLANYTDAPVTVALIAVTASSQTHSYSFDKTDAAAVIALWDKAEQVTSDKFVAVGSIAETGTTALDVMELAGGPAVRITIADPVAGSFSFDLQRSDYAAFDAALHKMADATTTGG